MGVDNRRKVGQCAECGNDRPIVARGMCRACYQRDYHARNKPTVSTPPPSPRLVVVKPRREDSPRPVVIPSVLAGLVREPAL